MSDSDVTLEAVRLTQHSAGWLLELAEASPHPDAAAAARWLDHIGSQAYQLATDAAAAVLPLLEGADTRHPRQ